MAVIHQALDLGHQPDRHRAGLRHRVDRGEGAAGPARRGGAVHQGAAGAQGPPAQAEATPTIGGEEPQAACAPTTSTSSSCTACRSATSTTRVEVLVPELLALKDEGLIRHLAASEAFASDNGHDSLGQSLDAGDDWYDVLMVGHNPFNPSARDRVLPATEERDIGVLVMFAVRKSLASAEGVRRVDRRPGGARGARRGAPSMPTIRSGSCSPTAGRPPSPRPPTASPVTSPAATWCSPAPVPSTTSPRTSPPSTARRSRSSTRSASRSSSATSTASAATEPPQPVTKRLPASAFWSRGWGGVGQAPQSVTERLPEPVLR